MGSHQGKEEPPLQLSLSRQSISTTITFDSRTDLERYMMHLSHRMSLRSIHIPKVIYYQPFISAGTSLCSNSAYQAIEVHFEAFGVPLSTSTFRPRTCKCVELLNAITQLRAIYGNFLISPQQVFVRVIGDYFAVRVWISSKVESCEVDQVATQQKMCQSIVQTFSIVFQQAACSNWKQMGKFHSFEQLKMTIIQQHSQKTQAIEITVPQKVTRKEIEFYSFREAISASNKVASPFQKPVQTATLPLTSHELHDETQKKQQKQAIPKLQFKQAKSLQGASPKFTERKASIEEAQSFLQQCPPVSVGSVKQSEEQLTTGRSPRLNYVMRESNDLTIFPNQYQMKFLRNHRINCSMQQNQRFLTFKRAMETIKSKQSQQSQPSQEDAHHETSRFIERTP